MNYQELNLSELRELAKQKGIGSVTRYKKAELIDLLEKVEPQSIPVEDEKPNYLEELDSGNVGEGILEVLSDGFGFLRMDNYLPGTKDIYVAPSQIRRFNLKTGDRVTGKIRIPKENEKFSALLYLTAVNGDKPDVAQRRPNFEDLTPVFPTENLYLETHPKELSTRLIDLVAPVGKGQKRYDSCPSKGRKNRTFKKDRKCDHK